MKKMFPTKSNTQTQFENAPQIFFLLLTMTYFTSHIGKTLLHFNIEYGAYLVDVPHWRGFAGSLQPPLILRLTS